MISIRQKGDFNNTERLFRNILGKKYQKILDKYAQRGVNALSVATPKDTGVTASSWGYEIKMDPTGLSIIWTNSNVKNGWFRVALFLQYGHGTRNGGWVEGIDYINPALRPIFDEIANAAWKEVVS